MFPKLSFLERYFIILIIYKHKKKNFFEFAQVPEGDKTRYYVKVNGQSRFDADVNEDWL